MKQPKPEIDIEHLPEIRKRSRLPAIIRSRKPSLIQAAAPYLISEDDPYWLKAGAMTKLNKRHLLIDLYYAYIRGNTTKYLTIPTKASKLRGIIKRKDDNGSANKAR